jgi:hypothetical protein
MSDFWNDLTNGYVNTTTTAIDEHLKEAQDTSMRTLTDKGRWNLALLTPVSEGTRVSFETNIGSVLTYPDPPPPGILGTVVTVRTPVGDSTSMGDMVFVKWDDERLMTIDRRHLRVARMRVSSLGDLTEFMQVTGDDKSGELVHKSTKDMWSMKEDGESWIIERLFDDTQGPLEP